MKLAIVERNSTYIAAEISVSRLARTLPVASPRAPSRSPAPNLHQGPARPKSAWTSLLRFVAGTRANTTTVSGRAAATKRRIRRSPLTTNTKSAMTRQINPNAQDKQRVDDDENPAREAHRPKSLPCPLIVHDGSVPHNGFSPHRRRSRPVQARVMGLSRSRFIPSR